MSKKIEEMTSLNLNDLDVEELERRVEMVVVISDTPIEDTPKDGGDTSGCGSLSSCPKLECFDKCYANF